MLFSDNLSAILCYKGSLCDVLHGVEAPHDDFATLTSDLSLLGSPDLHLERFFVFGLDQKVLANIFVAAALWVTLAKAKHLVDTVDRAKLGGDHATSFRAQLLLVGWIQQFAIPLVTRTFLRVLATVSALAKRGALAPPNVLLNILVEGHILCNKLKSDI